ncbi:MAG: PqqD family peptide modification chaperone [Longimicrobiales bacterium]
MIRRICEEYDAPVDAVRADMQRFFAELCRRRLVVNA